METVFPLAAACPNSDETTDATGTALPALRLGAAATTVPPSHGINALMGAASRKREAGKDGRSGRLLRGRRIHVRGRRCGRHGRDRGAGSGWIGRCGGWSPGRSAVNRNLIEVGFPTLIRRDRRCHVTHPCDATRSHLSRSYHALSGGQTTAGQPDSRAIRKTKAAGGEPAALILPNIAAISTSRPPGHPNRTCSSAVPWRDACRACQHRRCRAPEPPYRQAGNCRPAAAHSCIQSATVQFGVMPYSMPPPIVQPLRQLVALPLP